MIGMKKADILRMLLLTGMVVPIALNFCDAYGKEFFSYDSFH